MVIPLRSQSQVSSAHGVSEREHTNARALAHVFAETVSSHVRYVHGSGALVPSDRTISSSITPRQHNAPTACQNRRTWPALTAQVHQLLQWVGELQQRLAAQQHQQQRQQPQQQFFITGKEVRIEKFAGNGYHNWSDDMRPVLGTRQASIAATLKWAERRRDSAIDAAAVASAHVMEAVDNEALHAYILVYIAGEPRSIVKGCFSKGHEAWQKLSDVENMKPNKDH